MEKLTNKQTVYVTLPKKDYIESASEKVVIEEEDESWFQKILDLIWNRQKNRGKYSIKISKTIRNNNQIV